MDFLVAFESIKHDTSIFFVAEEQDKCFIVVADDENSARTYAERFAHIALSWDRGIGRLKDVRPARREEASFLPNLSQYEKQFPNR